LAENQKEQRAAKSVCKCQMQFNKQCRFYIKQSNTNYVSSLATNCIPTNSSKYVDNETNIKNEATNRYQQWRIYA